MPKGSMLAFMVFVCGCTDKAEPAYARCVKYEAENDVAAAANACSVAIAADPNSTSGKAAATKLKDLAPAIEKLKAEKAKADEAARQAAAEARAQHVKALKGKVSKEYWDADPDQQCTGKVLPAIPVGLQGRDVFGGWGSCDGGRLHEAHLLRGHTDLLLSAASPHVGLLIGGRRPNGVRVSKKETVNERS